MKLKTKIFLVLFLLLTILSLALVYWYNDNEKVSARESTQVAYSPFVYLLIDIIEGYMNDEKPETVIDLIYSLQKDFTFKYREHSIIPLDYEKWFKEQDFSIFSLDYEKWFEDTTTVIPAISNVTLLRENGTEAFTDGDTYDSVRARNFDFIKQKDKTFYDKRPVELGKNPVFNKFLESSKGEVSKKINNQNVYYWVDEKDYHYISIYKELYNKESCRKCHGFDHNIRGVIKVDIPLKNSYDKIDYNTYRIAVVCIFAVFIISLLIMFLIRYFLKRKNKYLSDNLQSMIDEKDIENLKPIYKDEFEILDKKIIALYDKLKAEEITKIETKKKKSEDSDVGVVSILTDKREAAIMTAELRNFESNFKDIEEEQQLDIINSYIDELKDILADNNGVLFRILGNKIVGIFQRDWKILNAVDTAVEMHRKVDELNHQHKVELVISSTVHGGEIVLGNLLEKDKFEAILIGSSLNAGLKLVDYTGDKTILVTDNIVKNVRKKYALKEYEEINVLGIEQPLKVFAVVGIYQTA